MQHMLLDWLCLRYVLVVREPMENREKPGTTVTQQGTCRSGYANRVCIDRYPPVPTSLRSKAEISASTKFGERETPA